MGVHNLFIHAFVVRENRVRIYTEQVEILRRHIREKRPEAEAQRDVPGDKEETEWSTG